MQALTDLMASIQAAPDDDGARLVYADLLSAQSDPRGELIQLQCRLARDELTGAERTRMRTRENALLKQIEPPIAQQLAALIQAPDPYVRKHNPR